VRCGVLQCIAKALRCDRKSCGVLQCVLQFVLHVCEKCVAGSCSVLRRRSGVVESVAVCYHAYCNCVASVLKCVVEELKCKKCCNVLLCVLQCVASVLQVCCKYVANVKVCCGGAQVW